MVESKFLTDPAGNPAGGVSWGPGIAIHWQNGPLSTTGNQQTGAFIEDLLSVVLARLDFYQAGKFACPANEETRKHVMAALEAQVRRTADRVRRGVEGAYAP